MTTINKIIPEKPPGDPSGYTEEQIYEELIRCGDLSNNTNYGVYYWIENYCKIYNNDARGWIDFKLWRSEKAIGEGYDDQISILGKMIDNNRLICLKSRQIGQTTLVLAYFLYEMLFNPISFVLLLSRGELEAKELLQRIKSMYSHLPYWMRPKEIVASSKTEWRLSNNSTALSLSSRRGDSYSATHVLIDEAALLHRANISLNQVLLNLAPTVGKSGKLFLISKTDKNKPESTFNSMYRAALTKSSDYTAAFIPYYVVPGRDKKWYNEQCEMSLSIDDTLDYVYESYPSTPEEALAPKSADKRLPYRWLEQCYHPIDPVLIVNNKLYDDVSVAIDYPEVPGLIIYKEPEDSRYLIVADPSEGTEGGDDAALIVFDIINKEEVATYTGKSEPSTLGGYIVKISEYYNYAAVLPERNHHGSALILWLKENSDIRVIQGWSPTERSRKPGWNTSAVSKSLAYDKTAEFLRKNECIIHNPDTFKQLSSIESSTLKAPGKRGDDDLAICFAIGIAGIELCLPKFSVSFLTIA